MHPINQSDCRIPILASLVQFLYRRTGFGNKILKIFRLLDFIFHMTETVTDEQGIKEECEEKEKATVG